MIVDEKREAPARPNKSAWSAARGHAACSAASLSTINAAHAPINHLLVLEVNRSLQSSLHLQLSTLERAIAQNERARRAASQGSTVRRAASQGSTVRRAANQGSTVRSSGTSGTWLHRHKASLSVRARPAVAPVYDGEDEENGRVLRRPPPLQADQHPRLSDASVYVPPSLGALRRSALAVAVPVKPLSARASTPWNRQAREQVPKLRHRPSSIRFPLLLAPCYTPWLTAGATGAQLRDGVVTFFMSAASRQILLRLNDNGFGGSSSRGSGGCSGRGSGGSSGGCSDSGIGRGSANGSLAAALCLLGKGSKTSSASGASSSSQREPSWELQNQIRWLQEESRKLTHARATDEQVYKLVSMGYLIDWALLSSCPHSPQP